MIVRFCFISLTLFSALVAQMMLGNLGLIMPFTATVTFYLTVVYGWRTGIIAAAAVGTALDLLYGNNGNYSAIALLLVAGLARWWLHSYDSRAIRITVFPGALCGLLVFLPQVRLLHPAWNYLAVFSLQLIFFLTVTALLLPLTVMILEKIARLTGMPRFREAKINLIHRKP